MFRFFQEAYEDAKNIKEKDPATNSIIEVVLLYNGFCAVFWHRFSHKLYKYGLRFLPRLISELVKIFTGIEIHPRC